ncbi:MAG: hypothetical protein ACKO83_11670, partial [Roseiflexaceae bacterium]
TPATASADRPERAPPSHATPIIAVWALYRVWGWRGWVGLALGGLLTLLLGLLGAPLSIWRAYLAVGLLPDAGPPRWSMNRSGLWNVLDRLLDAHAYTFDGVTYQLPAVWYQPGLVVPMAVVASLVVVGVTGWALQRSADSRVRMGMVLSCLLLVMPFQSTHYAVLLLVPIAVLTPQRQQWWVLALVAFLDTAVRYQYNMVRITQQTWPASAGMVMIALLWGWMVWQSVSALAPQSPTGT